MYPSGRWEGFWVQEGYGRQPMREFDLRFSQGEISGNGTDVVGPFTISGAYDVQTGRVLLVKQYIDKHAVQYIGDPDGEGSIQGTWALEYLGCRLTGSFLLRPVVRRPSSDEPIQDIA